MWDAGAPVELQLDKASVNRSLMSLIGGMTFVFALMAAGVGLWLDTLPEEDPWGFWVPLLRAFAFGGALVLVVIALGIHYVSHPPQGRILIDHEGITLDNPAVFRGPVRIPRAAVRSVSVERGTPALLASMPLDMFPIDVRIGSYERNTHMLSRRRAHYLLPGINPEPVTPNLAVVLEGMAEVSPIKFRGSLFPGFSPLKPPLWVRRIPGFFARVTDVEAAARAFESWGVLRPPRTEELHVALEAYRRQRRVEIAIGIGMFIALITLTEVLDS